MGSTPEFTGVATATCRWYWGRRPRSASCRTRRRHLTKSSPSTLPSSTGQLRPSPTNNSYKQGGPIQPGRHAFFGPLVGGEVILSHICLIGTRSHYLSTVPRVFFNSSASDAG